MPLLAQVLYLLGFPPTLSPPVLLLPIYVQLTNLPLPTSLPNFISTTSMIDTYTIRTSIRLYIHTSITYMPIHRHHYHVLTPIFTTIITYYTHIHSLPYTYSQNAHTTQTYPPTEARTHHSRLHHTPSARPPHPHTHPTLISFFTAIRVIIYKHLLFPLNYEPLDDRMYFSFYFCNLHSIWFMVGAQ